MQKLLQRSLVVSDYSRHIRLDLVLAGEAGDAHGVAAEREDFHLSQQPLLVVARHLHVQHRPALHILELDFELLDEPADLSEGVHEGLVNVLPRFLRDESSQELRLPAECALHRNKVSPLLVRRLPVMLHLLGLGEDRFAHATGEHLLDLNLVDVQKMSA